MIPNFDQATCSCLISLHLQSQLARQPMNAGMDQATRHCRLIRFITFGCGNLDRLVFWKVW